jgi:hypothetical protein
VSQEQFAAIAGIDVNAAEIQGNGSKAIADQEGFGLGFVISVRRTEGNGRYLAGLPFLDIPARTSKPFRKPHSEPAPWPTSNPMNSSASI